MIRRQAARRPHRVAVLMLVLAGALPGAASAQAAAPAPPQIPVREGLTVVTAVGDPRGDFESIKRITRIDANTLRIQYSADLPPVDDANPLAQALGAGCRDEHSDRKQKVHGTGVRIVRRPDLESARQYHPYFEVCTGEEHEYPGTTALGLSTGLLKELKTAGQVKLSVATQGVVAALGNLLGAFLGGGAKGGVSKLPDANDLDVETGTISRVEREPVRVKIIVNDQPTELPAVHARGRIGDHAVEFWFLDDVANPLALKWSMGEQHLQAVKISFPEKGATTTSAKPGSATGEGPPSPSSGAARIERELTDEGRAVVYGIYFDFASDRLKPESQPVLADIAKVMQQHPAWSLAVEGHTDSIGGDPYNLDLSKRRAAAVKQALVGEYRIDPKRLDPSGYGASRPKDTNATLEGRARNRRVELVKR